MKKNAIVVLLLVSILSAGFVSCKKSGNEKQKEEKEGEKEDPNLSPYLKGSDYYLVTLDAQSEKHIKSKIKKDYRTDDKNMFLYVWDGTYSGGTSSGPNSLGEVEGWTSLIVSNKGWSGCGFSPSTTFFVDLSGVSNDHVLHLAMKSKDAASHQLVLNDGKKEAKVTIGAAPFEGLAPYTNFARDGEWHHIEIPMSVFTEKGLRYTEGGFKSNVVAILSGGVAGTELNIDAIFFYKKNK